MGMRFEWADVNGPGATIWDALELAEVGDDGNYTHDAVGVSMDTGSNGVMLWGSREALIAWAEDVAARLRAGEGASPLGEERLFEFPDAHYLVRDADGDVYEVGQLDGRHALRDNSGALIDDGVEPEPLTGDLWRVMGEGGYAQLPSGRGRGFVVATRKVID